MKKTELVHLHALLVLLSEELVDRGVVDRSYFDSYTELGVSPVSFRSRRDHHEEAVLVLAELLADALAEESFPPVKSESLYAESESSSS